MNEEQQVFYHLGVALAIGLMIGVERGWEEREAAEGARVAGVRTYGLIGLLGGGAALVSGQLGALVAGLAFIGVSGMMIVVYVANLRTHDDIGITSVVAALLAFVLGALAATGEVGIAAAAAVITTLLLSYKPQLHRWVGALEVQELRAGIKLLLISVVLLPVLPDRGFGPWDALNPYTIWWMVVLIAAISFVGYFAIKLGGPRRGAFFTGIFGGLASSTALTLHFSRTARRDATLAPALGMGILLACGTMFVRMLLVASIINPALTAPLFAPIGLMALLAFVPALWSWRTQPSDPGDTVSALRNPLELSTAVGFGVLLAVVLVLGQALRSRFGDAGLLALAAASGLADVDAITLSLSRLSEAGLAPGIAVHGIVLAGAVNSLIKGGIAFFIGGRRLGTRVVLPLATCALGGPALAWVTTTGLA